MTGSRTRHLHKAGALLQAQTQTIQKKQLNTPPNQREPTTQQSQPVIPYQEQQKHKKTRLTQTVTLSQPQVKR